ncbi:MAG TPA: hypothetical protein PKO15_01615 [Fibrobacteria bacterium]|nr:hypothetical protein [Fibrobacteria bacterium]HOX49940.1 hypothetical protein [Fibrobacteria bacterium]
MSKLYDQLVTILGDIKIFRYPFWMVYDPGSYKIKGPESRLVQSLLQPGDILLRRYDGYLDGRIIGGAFSHAALYVGQVSEADKAEAPPEGRTSRYFETGPEMVSHSTAEGVHLEDILTFLRCDGVAVLRLPKILHRCKEDYPVPTDLASWHPKEQEIYERLVGGGEVAFEEVWPLAREVGMGKLGTQYDFAFKFEDGNRLSCTEYVAHAYRCLRPVMGIVPTRQAFLGGLRHQVVIRPQDYLKSVLERIHISPSAVEPMRKYNL